jgi:5-methyltetrahydrofolate--homocysteine methyltransferase
VKIAPEYDHSVVHVLDASRAVGAVSSVIDADRRKVFDEENRADQARLRELHGGKRVRPILPLADARANALVLPARTAEKPPFVGAKPIEVDLAELVPYIDWTFFFTAWELRGRYPQILEHPEQGKVARELFDAAKKTLDRLVSQKLLRARGVYGFWPAKKVGEDIVLYDDEARSKEKARFPMLRQQQAKTESGEGKHHLSLADFVGAEDYVGAFAVTAGLGVTEVAEAYAKDHDDYHAIIAKALADRLAEAFAEMLHERVRRAWYAKDEKLSNEDLMAEKYRGIRPALGYPACPDHVLKRRLFELLPAAEQGITLTSSCAMSPAASVSGLYLGHPDARYFNLGKIGRDQLEDYARRMGESVEEAEKWLAPNLG